MDKEEVQKRLEKVEKENRRLREEMERIKGNKEHEAVLKDNKISRRGFLKKMGLGAAGIGALSLAPATSRLKLTKNGISASNLDISGSTTLQDSLDVGGNQIQNAGSVNTKTIVEDYHFAGAFDGSDPDSRLDNAISAAGEGDTIYLESKVYDATRTISKKLTICGTQGGNMHQTGTEIHSDWTVESVPVGIFNVSGYDGSTQSLLTINSSMNGVVMWVNNFDISLQDSDYYILSNLRNLVVDIDSNSTNNIVDSSTAVNVSDNGTSNLEGSVISQ